MMIRSLAACALLASALSAQTPPCYSMNDATDQVVAGITAFAFAGNAYAYQFQVPATTTLRAAEIFTGNSFLSSGFHTLEIYDSNFIFQPGTRLGGGTFQNEGGLGVGWHGANFDAEVTCNPGPTYWLIWREPGFSQVPNDPAGSGTPWSTWNGSTWVTQATLAAVKWRGYCSLLDGAGLQVIGDGCQNSGGTVGTMFSNFEPTVGNVDFQLEASGFAPGSLGVIALGTDPAWISFPFPGMPAGCELHTDVIATEVVSCGTGDNNSSHLPGGPGYAGHTFFPFPIPSTSGLVGAVFNSQFAMLDLATGASFPFVTTNGLRFTIL